MVKGEDLNTEHRDISPAALIIDENVCHLSPKELAVSTITIGFCF